MEEEHSTKKNMKSEEMHQFMTKIQALENLVEQQAQKLTKLEEKQSTNNNMKPKEMDPCMMKIQDLENIVEQQAQKLKEMEENNVKPEEMEHCMTKIQALENLVEQQAQKLTKMEEDLEHCFDQQARQIEEIEKVQQAPDSTEFPPNCNENKGFTANVLRLQKCKDIFKKKIFFKDTPKIPPRQIDVLDPVPTEATEHFYSKLYRFVNEEDVFFRKQDVTMMQNDSCTIEPIILICNNFSRLETDLINTVSMVNPILFKRLIVIVLHCKSRRCLPITSSKEKLVHISKQYDFIDIVDMAFNVDTDILYTCNINKQAKIQLKKSLKRTFGVTTSKTTSIDKSYKENTTTLDCRENECSDKCQDQIIYNKKCQKEERTSKLSESSEYVNIEIPT